MELFEYQKEAVSFIKDKKKAYLALDMGMGKTLTSISSQEGRNILLIAEKNEIVNSQNFRNEVEKYFGELTYFNLRETSLDDVGENTLCGINPDGLIKLDLKKVASYFDTVIIDEATFAKTTTTKRFKLIQKIVKEIDHLVLLSGTPMMNGASELYAPLLLMENPMVFGKKVEARKAFDIVFAGGHSKRVRYTGKWFQDYIWWNKGANNVRVLRYLLRDNFFIMSKDQTDVFKKKVRSVEKVTMSYEWLADYKYAWEHYLVDAKKRKVNLDNVSELRNLIEKGQCYQVNSRYKAKQVAEDIANKKYGDKRIVVFTMFIESYKILQSELEAKGVTFKTFDEVNEWKEGTEQVLVGRIKAHGKGGNLPEASVCIFVDMDFVPSNNIQAENRIDRPEQKEDMKIIYYLTDAEGSVDHHVRQINKDKISKITEFMKPLTEEEITEMPQKIEELRVKFRKPMEILGI